MPYVVFVGSPTSNVDDPAARTAGLPFPYFLPRPMLVGKVIEYGDGDGVNRTRYRYSIEGKTKGEARSVTGAPAGSGMSDFGRALYVAEQVLAMEHTWILQVYEADLPSGPPASRAVYDRSSVSAPSASEDHFWYYTADRGDGYPVDATRGVLPMKVRLTEQLAWDNLSGGRIGLTFTLQSALIYASHT